MDTAITAPLRLLTALASFALFAQPLASPPAAPLPSLRVIIITVTVPRETRPWCWQRECCPCGPDRTPAAPANFRLPMNSDPAMWPVILSYDSRR